MNEVEINGIKHEIEFERRKYGSTTFTWAYLVEGEGPGRTRRCLGDPYPATRYPKVLLTKDVGRAIMESPNDR